MYVVLLKIKKIYRCYFFVKNCSLSAIRFV